MRTKYLGVFFLVLLALCGCAERVEQCAESRPPVLIEVPQTRQATNYTCGVAVVQSILAYNGFPFREDVLAEKVKANPDRGTAPEAMMSYLAEHGVGTRLVQNMTLADLRGFIDASRPVICFLQAWNEDPAFDYSDAWEDGHYAIAIGYDAERVYFMDPSTIANYTYIPNQKFLSRWHDGDEKRRVYQAGIVVTNPSPKYKRNAFLPLL